MTIMLWALACLYVFWLLYLAGINIMNVRAAGQLPRLAVPFAAPVVLVVYLLDVLMNWTLFIIIFCDLPHEPTVTLRLRRYKAQVGWRTRLANLIAISLLDPFDRSGRHV